MARKILLADDSVTAQNMGRKILADAGYEVITVNNGSAALKKIAELKPDLVILDVYMPGYSGLEVCQRLKESPDSARIPVLLTVGKLEPFKPEEAQRVRAEGFIVKPFEASELLSALSKLEDKVVPRAEPSKPGRFARAIAAAEESTRAGRDESSGDDGWKSRIGFPRQKTEPEEKTADDTPIYNPMNRDLRTVVETPAELAAEKAAEKAIEREEKQHQKEKVAEASVDVAALVPPGLPKDVTPEELAAIAAAAAQIQMSGAATKDELPVSEAASHASPAPAPEPAAENLPGVSASPVSAAIAEAASQNKIESQGTETAAAATDRRPNGGEGSEQAQDVPVTMAVATESTVPAHHGPARWTAVTVALEAEEATISLEQEMQKAYAAFVAEETAATASSMETATPVNYSAAPELAAQEPAGSVSNPEPPPLPQDHVNAVAIEPKLEPVTTSPPVAASNFSAEPVSLPEPAIVSIPQPEPVVSSVVAESVAPEVALADPQPVPTAEFVSPVGEAEVGSPAVPELQPVAEAEAVTAETAAAPSNAIGPIADTEEHKEKEKEEDSETVKNTAAAWASWRQIRDTGETQNPAEPARQEFDIPVPQSPQSAAMAVAAGAGQITQDASAVPKENPGDVASIVDSVLADLRPRLMAEITRKMAEKK